MHMSLSITQRVWFPWLAVLIILLGLACIFSPVVIIRSGHAGVATFFGEVQGDIYEPGLHFKYPLLRVHQFDLRTQSHDVSAGVVTEDMQLVTVSVTLKYQLDEEVLRKTYQEIGQEAEKVVIDPATKEALNAAATKFTAAELVSKRNEFKTSLQTELEERLLDSGVKPAGLAIVEIKFSKGLTEAFEAKTTAAARAETAKLEADKAASQLRTATSLSAAEADRIRIVGGALKGHEAYIQYELLQKWDGESPLYLSPPVAGSNYGYNNKKLF